MLCLMLTETTWLICIFSVLGNFCKLYIKRLKVNCDKMSENNLLELEHGLYYNKLNWSVHWMFNWSNQLLLLAQEFCDSRIHITCRISASVVFIFIPWLAISQYWLGELQPECEIMLWWCHLTLSLYSHSFSGKDVHFAYEILLFWRSSYLGCMKIG